MRNAKSYFLIYNYFCSLEARIKQVLVFLVLIVSSKIFGQNEIVGKWNAGKENSIVEIYENSGELFGKIISCDRAEVVGKINLRNLEKKGDHWEGELYVFKRRSWYDVSIHEENDTLYLVISVGFFEKEVQWPRD
ncbi:MAG: DUF2147 domain-containing protein [Cryomorphaceae bacterium]